MINYYIKEDDIILIFDEGSVNFDPKHNSLYSDQYKHWLEQGNQPQEWPHAN